MSRLEMASVAELIVPTGRLAAISECDFSLVEDLIEVWRNDELLNALGAMGNQVDSVLVPFDASADRPLVELLLVWRVDSECSGGSGGPSRLRGLALCRPEPIIRTQFRDSRRHDLDF
ncbi:MAG: hypothetical protein ACRDTJ_05610 [Pseudonocardiaceae bacterium]